MGDGVMKREVMAFELFKIYWLACDCAEVTDTMIEAAFKAADNFIAKANLVNDHHQDVKSGLNNVVGDQIDNIVEDRPSGYVSYCQMGDILCVRSSLIRHWARLGRIPKITLPNGQYIFDPHAVIEALEKNK
jgi:hypothetical protein